MCKEFTPLLIAAKGIIVQVGSVAGEMPYVFGGAYNASKAALHAYSNTLRVELAPFGVKVVIIVTGGVLSQIARVDRVLAPDSLYLPIEADYIRRTKHSQEVGIPADRYAKQVVSKLAVRNPPREIWAGYGVRLVWFASTFLPRSILVRSY
jgi:1-acylglycerone phosphate reductase